MSVLILSRSKQRHAIRRSLMVLIEELAPPCLHIVPSVQGSYFASPYRIANRIAFLEKRLGLFSSVFASQPGEVVY